MLMFSRIHCLQKTSLVKANCAVATTFLTSVFCGGFSNGQVSNKVVQFDGIKWRKLPSMKSVRCGSAATFHKGTVTIYVLCIFFGPMFETIQARNKSRLNCSFQVKQTILNAS